VEVVGTEGGAMRKGVCGGRAFVAARSAGRLWRLVRSDGTKRLPPWHEWSATWESKWCRDHATQRRDLTSQGA
jgi:hypothetical protein